MEIPKEWLEQEGGFQKHVFVEGEGKNPEIGQIADVRYRGKNKDFVTFEEIWNDDGESCEFEIGKFPGARGVDTAIQGMKKGERSLFRFPSSLGFREEGFPPHVDPGDEVYYEIELVDFFDQQLNKFDYKEEERPAIAEKLKTSGNNLLAHGDLEAADKKYELAFEMVEWDTKHDVKALKVSIRNNQCLILFKKKDWKGLIEMVKKTLEIERKNIKALLRGGRAYREIQDYEKAEAYFREGLMLEPDNTEIKHELTVLQKDLAASNKKQASAYSNMFRGGLYTDLISPDIEYVDDPRAYFSIKIGEKEPQKVVFKLFEKIAPKTVKNFLALCDPSNKDSEGSLTYLNSIFHRLIKGFMIQGGDFEKGNGTGGRSIYGRNFADESFVAKHSGRGLLSMANAGPNTNGSQFFILFKDTPHLDGKHVVFGRVIENEAFLDVLEKTEVDSQDKPIDTIKIVDCGIE